MAAKLDHRTLRVMSHEKFGQIISCRGHEYRLTPGGVKRMLAICMSYLDERAKEKGETISYFTITKDANDK